MQVISRLKRKMVVTVLVVQAAVFAVILSALNVALYRTSFAQTARAMEAVVSRGGLSPDRRQPFREESGGDIPVPRSRPGPDTGGELMFLRQFLRDFVSDDDSRGPVRSIFSVQVAADGSSCRVVSGFPLRYTEEELSSLVLSVGSAEDTRRPRYVFAEGGTFLYVKSANPPGFLVVFADYTEEMQVTVRLVTVSLAVYLLALLVATAAAWFVAERSVRPVREAFEAQKQFVADAGHELKTPVTVIGANADALAGEIGGNKWLGYIKSEVSRMDSLVSDLLYLAKNDAGRTPLSLSRFDLGRAVEAAVLPFESMIFEQRKILELSVAEGVSYSGDRRRISQVVAILVDNAVKNSPEGALIRVSLGLEPAKRRGAARSGGIPVISVYNQGEGLERGEMRDVFKRFYRADSSRARETGGSGLGLSIADAIVRAHGGSIGVDGEKGSWISFTVRLGRAGRS